MGTNGCHLRELEDGNRRNDQDSGQNKENDRPKNEVQVVQDSDGEVLGIYFQTESQRKLYSKIGTVLQMGGTYDTKNPGYLLYNLLGVDNNGESQPLAQFFTKNETKEALAEFLQIFTEEGITTQASQKSPFQIRTALRTQHWKIIFRDKEEESLSSYCQLNWFNIAPKWTNLGRRHLPTFGNNTTNRLER
uniref:ZSWIM1/3 RNaseH-like domain-containing protein n=1 Tax=Daphnia galeata TaxID=27404 RepID=A0A8J2WPB5_9CRUS|nr:unnamed protein product [Daphnia galeata]